MFCGLLRKGLPRSTARRAERVIYPIEEEFKVRPSSPQVKITADFLDALSREVNYCGFCKEPFNFASNQLKIHCNICNKFYHCGIAGKCIGDDCKIITEDGSVHQASYCIHCVSKIFSENKCLCKDCDNSSR